MRKKLQFCTNDNYFCRCIKCRLAIEKAIQMEFTAMERDIKIERDCRSSRGKLSDELMREVL